MWFLLLLWVSGPKNTIDPELLHALKARSIGPAGMSGRVTALAVPSHLPETLYLGAATGGVWKSTNGGLSFQPIFDDQPVHAIGAIAVHEQVNDHVWVGTGEGNVRNSTSIGAGVFRSLDGGKTWSCVGLEKTERINKILLHPQSTQTAYIAAMGQLWGENEERGVYRTTNGGASWSPVLQVNPSTGATDLAMDPQNPDKLFAALWQFRRWPHFFKSGGPGSGLYLTYDGGNNWKKLGPEQGLPDGELGRIAVAIAPSNHQIVYALIESKQSGLYKSEDGGQHFTLINSKSDIADRPFYYHRIVVDPQDAHRVYLVQTLVRVSEDGGKSFQTLSGASWPNIHVDYHAMWVDPLHPNRMYVGNDGGVAESRDYGKSFRFISNLPLAQFYHIHFDMDQPYHLYGGLQDNGSWRGPSATNRQGGIRNHLWELVSFGDGFDTVPDPQDSTKGYSMSQGGNLYRWDIKDGSSQVIMPAAPDGTKLRFNWNSGLALDPFQPGTLYYGSQFVHKSTDKGATWQTISPDLTTNTADWQKQDESGGLTIDVTAAENYTTLVTIAPSPIKEGLIWVGSDDGRIHVTQDGGTTWTSVESGLKGVGKNGWIAHIEPSKFEPGSAFAVVDRHRWSDAEPYVYRTDNFGKSWQKISDKTIQGYALCIEQDPVDPNLLFLGTEFGLWFTLDGGKNWMPFRNGIGTVSAMDLAIHPRENDLIIATHGRALYIVDDISPLRALTPAIMEKGIHLFPAGSAYQFPFLNMAGTISPGSGEFRGTNRPYGAFFDYILSDNALPSSDKPGVGEGEKPKDKAVFIISDEQGKIVRHLSFEPKRGLNRAVWAFESDPFKQAPNDPDNPFPAESSGPVVPPGTYQVRLEYKDLSAETEIHVHLQQETSEQLAAHQAIWEWNLKLGHWNDSAVDMIRKLQAVKDEIGQRRRQLKRLVQDLPEYQRTKIDEDPRMKALADLEKSIGDLEKELWIPPGTPGILPDSDVLSAIQRGMYFLNSATGKPTPNLEQHLNTIGQQVESFTKKFESFQKETLTPWQSQSTQP